MTLEEKTILIDSLLADKDTFNNFVYTSWKDALITLRARRTDDEIQKLSQRLFPHGIPGVIADKPAMVLFRNIATPNYETFRFLICADVMDELRPVFFEYTRDKFTDINPSKYALGMLCYYQGLNKLRQPIVTYHSVVDMDRANGKKFTDITTKMNEPFVDFHHRMLTTQLTGRSFDLYDASEWLLLHGNRAADYYLPFLALFIRDGILFENFLFSKEEMWFNRNVILPALIDIRDQTGHKPLIVALEPTNIEGDLFWTSYPMSAETVFPKNT